MATATAGKTAKTPVTTARLRAGYKQQIAADLLKELALTNPHQVPRLEKITINVGLGKAKDDKKVMDVATNTLTKITGQKPIETVAKKNSKYVVHALLLPLCL